MKRALFLPLILGAAIAANADPLSMSPDTSAGANGYVSIYTHSEHAFIGRLGLSFDNTNYLGFCADASTEYTGGGDYTMLDTSFLPPTLPNAHQHQIAYLTNKYTTSISDGLTGAAVQLAIWDLLYNAQPSDVTDSSQAFFFQSSDSTDSVAEAALANSFLAEANANATNADVSIYFQPNGTNQSFVSNSVPEPATIAAMVGGLLLIRRRKRSV